MYIIVMLCANIMHADVNNNQNQHLPVVNPLDIQLDVYSKRKSSSDIDLCKKYVCQMQ